jgi:hypothetical protein
MKELPRFEGVAKTIGGVEYIIPPISLRTFKQLQDVLELFEDGVVDAKTIDTAVTVIHAALNRNYPDITIDDVAEIVDIGNMFEIFEVVMDVSGLKRKALEEESLSGELTPNQN